MEVQNSQRQSKRRRLDSYGDFERDNFVYNSSSPNHDPVTATKAQLELVSASSSNEKKDLSEEESSVICLEIESSSSTEMEHYCRPKKKRKNSSTEDYMSPSAGELDEFFSKAEKYDHKRFAEKYNYDIEKDVPIEGGRYQWIHL